MDIKNILGESVLFLRFLVCNQTFTFYKTLVWNFEII